MVGLKTRARATYCVFLQNRGNFIHSINKYFRLSLSQAPEENSAQQTGAPQCHSCGHTASRRPNVKGERSGEPTEPSSEKGTEEKNVKSRDHQITTIIKKEIRSGQKTTNRILTLPVNNRLGSRSPFPQHPLPAYPSCLTRQRLLPERRKGSLPCDYPGSSYAWPRNPQK